MGSFFASWVAMSRMVLSNSGLKMLEASPTRMMAPAPWGESIILFEFSNASIRAFEGMIPDWQAPMAPMNPTSSASVKSRRTSGAGFVLPVTCSKSASATATAARSSHPGAERTPLAIFDLGRSQGMRSLGAAWWGLLNSTWTVLKICFFVGWCSSVMMPLGLILFLLCRRRWVLRKY